MTKYLEVKKEKAKEILDSVNVVKEILVTDDDVYSMIATLILDSS